MDEERRFIAHARRNRKPMVAIDIPLLYEIGADAHMDAVIVVTAPRVIQTMRVMRRRGMTLERLVAILARQLPDREKRRRADFIVQTGGTRRDALRKLKTIVDSLQGSPAPRSKRRAALGFR
jgi:dephospho-CoA kinase